MKFSILKTLKIVVDGKFLILSEIIVNIVSFIGVLMVALLLLRRLMFLRHMYYPNISNIQI